MLGPTLIAASGSLWARCLLGAESLYFLEFMRHPQSAHRCQVATQINVTTPYRPRNFKKNARKSCHTFICWIFYGRGTTQIMSFFVPSSTE